MLENESAVLQSTIGNRKLEITRDSHFDHRTSYFELDLVNA